MSGSPRTPWVTDGHSQGACVTGVSSCRASTAHRGAHLSGREQLPRSFRDIFYDCLSQYSIAKPLQWPNRMGSSSVVRDSGQAQLVLIANSSVTGILLLRLSSAPGIVPWVEKTNTLTYVPRALLSRTAVLDMTLAPPGTSLIFHLPTK